MYGWSGSLINVPYGAYLDHCYAWNLQTHFLRVFVANLKNDAIYGFYLESFCDKHFAIRKVFAFSDSAVDIHSWSLFSNRNPKSPPEHPASGPSSYRSPLSTVDLQSTRSQHHQGTRPYASPWINAHANSMSAESNVRMSDQPIPNVNMTASSNLDKFPAPLPRTSGLGASTSSNPASVDTHSLSQNPDNGEIFPDLPPSYEMAMMDETDLP